MPMDEYKDGGFWGGGSQPYYNHAVLGLDDWKKIGMVPAALGQ